MRFRLGIMVLLAAAALARGQDTNIVIDDAAIVWVTNDWWDLGRAITNSAVYCTNAVVYEGDWEISSKVSFGDGITLDTKTGEVEFPASVTNMTEVARQFWRAVCAVSESKLPEWLKEEETK